MKGVLFLCVANSARSQMAEGLARQLLSNTVNIFSAGSTPGKLNPLAIVAMQELGIDISSQYSKPMDAIPQDQIDTVITLCAEEICPIFPGKVTKLHWPLPDPAAFTGTKQLETFRSVRDELKVRILGLI